MKWIQHQCTISKIGNYPSIERAKVYSNMGMTGQDGIEYVGLKSDNNGKIDCVLLGNSNNNVGVIKSLLLSESQEWVD